MRAMRYLPLVFLAACATAPATRSPLRDQLAVADSPSVRQATSDCLSKGGWKVDPLYGVSGGADVVHASKGDVATEVYINSADVKPRITGGPDDRDPFWACLSATLSPAKS
jgi:hypothetical protein